MVKTELAEILRKVAFSIDDYAGKVATFHELDEDPETVLEVVNFFTLNELIAV